MNRHRFDAISVVFGVIVATLGVLVAAGSLDDIDADAGTWGAAAALALGLGMIPWARRRSEGSGQAGDDGSARDGHSVTRDGADTTQ